jgi:hypothetical protein
MSIANDSSIPSNLEISTDPTVNSEENVNHLETKIIGASVVYGYLPHSDDSDVS